MTPDITPREYLERIRQTLAEAGSPERAIHQAAYMKHQFDFFGLGNPEWRKIAKSFFRTEGVYHGEALTEFVQAAFESEYREMHYAAVQMCEAAVRKEEASFIELLEWTITHQSWWDTVDWIAKLAGIHFQRFPELRLPVTEHWMKSGHMWLQRVCLIFQLSYKEETDFDLMKRYILALSDSKEFFIRKGAGWALRQYARVNPEGVREFVEGHPELSNLTKREAMKHL